MTPSATGPRRGAEKLAQLAWLPIPVFLAAILICSIDRTHGSSESPYLLLGLNLLAAVVSGVIGWTATISFLSQRSISVLLLGCGAVSWGTSGLVACVTAYLKDGRGGIDANTIVTIHNSGMWVSALCHLGGAIASKRAQKLVKSPLLWAWAIYACVGMLMILITMATVKNWLPMFFVQGEGGTIERHMVLGSAIAIFLLTIGMLRPRTEVTGSTFLHWYSLGLLMLVVGLTGVLLQSYTGSRLGWLGRAAQLVGSAYTLVALLTSTAKDERPRIELADLDMSGARHGYGLAIVLVLTVTALRLLLMQGGGLPDVHVMFFPAVTLAALYGGLGPGLYATLLSGLAISFLWVDRSDEFAQGTPAHWLTNVIFFIGCILTSWITDRMRQARIRACEAEKEMKAAMDQYRALFEKSPDAILLTIPDGGILAANPAASEIFGMSEAEIREAGRDGLCDVQDPRLAAALKRRKITGHFSKAEVTHIRKNGERFPAELDSVVLPGDPPRAFVILRDISERKRSQEEILRLNQELELRVQERTAELNRTVEELRQEVAERKHAEERVRRISARLGEIRESERSVIAKELHDEIGQLLTGLNMMLGMVERRLPKPLPRELEQMREVVEELMNRIRELSINLRPMVLDYLGLVEALGSHIDQYRKRTRIMVHFEKPIYARRLSPEIETALFRVTQEALTNVARHADTRDAVVKLWTESNRAHLEIKDEGKGFDTKMLAPITAGVLGMSERMLSLGGSFEIDSAAGKGTVVRASVPLRWAG